MSYKNGWSVAAGLLGLLLGATAAGAQDWSFSGVDRIEIRGASGDVKVRPSPDAQVRVELVSRVQPEDAFEPRVEQNAATLRIDERWRGGSSSGGVQWTILVPAGNADLDLSMDTASGDLDVEGVAGRIELETASGDIALTKVQLGRRSELGTASGDFVLRDVTVGEDCELTTASGDIECTAVTFGKGCEMSTASGDVEVVDCKGPMELSSASGDVVVKNCALTDTGEFSSASGDVTLQLANLPGVELSASAASGDVSLDVADFGANFTLTLVKRQDRGRIVCPFDFTSERTYEDRHVYEEKVVKRGTGGPEVFLKTASGSVTVRK